MENAADALQMAFYVFVFVFAITISVNSFGQASKTSQAILDYNDREYDYTYVEEAGTTQRIVGPETIIPAIYRAYKENYKIVFLEADGTTQYELYKKKENGIERVINYIDLSKENLADDNQREQFINSLLFGNKYSEWESLTTTNNIKNKIILQNDGIYGTIKRYKFIEKIGVYYEQELDIQSEEDNNVPDINKTIRRVITYERYI